MGAKKKYHLLPCYEFSAGPKKTRTSSSCDVEESMVDPGRDEDHAADLHDFSFGSHP